MGSLQDIVDMIARLTLRDRAALSALHGATSAKLFRIALRVLIDRTEAENALQEIFVKLWHNAGRYRSNGLSPMTWLITGARNHAIDRLRARRGQRSADLDEVAEMPDTSINLEAAAISASVRGRISTCLQTLPTDRADAVCRAYLMGETYHDLARRFGVPLNTMRTWLRRSLLKLRECMET